MSQESTMQKLVDNLVDGGPRSSTPFRAHNTTAIDGTTARTIKAAPGEGFRLVITSVHAVNPTASENPTILLKDTTDPTPVEHYRCAPGSAGDGREHKSGRLGVPIKLAEDLALTGEATGAVGDTTVHVEGYIEAI